MNSIIWKLNFYHDKYFYSRPFMVGHNRAGINNTNTNPKYPALVKDRFDSFMVHNSGVNKTDIWSEMVNANGSGLSPHISMEGAKIKIKTITKIRNISEANLKELVEKILNGLYWI